MRARSCIVGIAGGSASGKTSLTRALRHFLEQETPALRVDVVNVDGFYRADKSQGPTFTSPSRGDEQFNFNHPDALDVERLLSHITSCSRAQDAPQVLLVEGLMVLHIPKVRETLDVRVFVELEADVRALRRLLRDVKGERGNADPAWIATYYLESAKVGHDLFVEPSRVYADFIIRGDAQLSRLIPLLAAAIASSAPSPND